VPDAGTAKLSFWYRIVTEDTFINYYDLTQPADTLDVEVLESSGMTTLFGRFGGPVRPLRCGEWHDSGWIKYSVEISRYAGQVITIRFSLNNRIDGFYNTYGYLDDVSVMWYAD
jgi:hypothetical protein